MICDMVRVCVYQYLKLPFYWLESAGWVLS